MKSLLDAISKRKMQMYSPDKEADVLNAKEQSAAAVEDKEFDPATLIASLDDASKLQLLEHLQQVFAKSEDAEAGESDNEDMGSKMDTNSAPDSDDIEDAEDEEITRLDGGMRKDVAQDMLEQRFSNMDEGSKPRNLNDRVQMKIAKALKK